MITKSDSREVREVALALKAGLNLLEEDLERELLRAGADVVVIVSHRIKQEGKDASGNTLETRSADRSGAYSSRYAKTRQKAGRQITRVDSNMTGQMMIDYNLTERSKRAVGVGFITEESNQKAEYLEEYYGNDIYIPSESEETDVMDDTMQRVQRLIDKIL